MDKETLLSCRDVSLGYEGHTVWEHLTFSVHSGEYLCIVGENGSGKSTLLKSLLGSSGEVRPPGRWAICPSRPRLSGIFPPPSAR